MALAISHSRLTGSPSQLAEPLQDLGGCARRAEWRRFGLVVDPHERFVPSVFDVQSQARIE